MIRDVNVLNDGHYYLPGHSIPYVGEQLAKLNGLTIDQFMVDHYAGPVGRAYADMLLNFGLRPEYHNPQNVLIQLDRKLKPTGKIVFRDLSDTNFVKQIIDHLPNADLLRAQEERLKVKIDEYFIPHTPHLFFNMQDWLTNLIKARVQVKLGGTAAYDQLAKEEPSELQHMLYENGIKFTEPVTEAFRTAIIRQLEFRLNMQIQNKFKGGDPAPFFGTEAGQLILQKFFRNRHLARSEMKMKSRIKNISVGSQCRELFVGH